MESKEHIFQETFQGAKKNYNYILVGHVVPVLSIKIIIDTHFTHFWYLLHSTSSLGQSWNDFYATWPHIIHFALGFETIHKSFEQYDPPVSFSKGRNILQYIITTNKKFTTQSSEIVSLGNLICLDILR